ncbi:Rho-type gtpase-activating protein, partial [Spiromyces aspiralis]
CGKRIRGKSFAKTSQDLIFCVPCYNERRERKRTERKQKDLLNKELPSIPQNHDAAPVSAGSRELGPNDPSRRGGGGHDIDPFDHRPLNASRERKEGFLRNFFGSQSSINDDEHHHQHAHSTDCSRSASINQGNRGHRHQPHQRADNASAHPRNSGDPPIPRASGGNTPGSAAPRIPSLHFDSSYSVVDDLEALALSYTRTSLRLAKSKGGDDKSNATSDTLVSSQGLLAGSEMTDGEKWLSVATSSELREELLVTQHHLNRIESNYNSLKALHVKVSEQLLDARAMLKRELGRCTEHEALIAKLRQEIAILKGSAGAPESTTMRESGEEAPRPLRASQDSALPTALTKRPLGRRERGRSLSNTIQLDCGDPDPKGNEDKTVDADGISSPLYANGGRLRSHNTVLRRGSRSIVRVAAKCDTANAKTAPRHGNYFSSDDENYDDLGREEECVIAPITHKPIGKRFNWIFNNSGTASPADGSKPSNANPTSVPSNGPHHRQQQQQQVDPNNSSKPRTSAQQGRQHLFQLQPFLRPSKCDACSEKIWGLNSRDLRCKACGFNCHTKCASQVPPSCPGIELGSAGAVAMVDPSHADAADPFAGEEIFGVSLLAQAAKEKRDIPWLIHSAVAFVDEHGLEYEGVYRKSGSTGEIKQVQRNIATILRTGNYHLPIAPPHTDVSNITSIIKQYLRDLPDPLMTYDTYPDWMRSTTVADIDDRIQAYRDACSKMPDPHRHTLVFLMHHLHRIAENSAVNRMNARNLAVVVAPNVLHLPKARAGEELMDMAKINHCISFLIENAYKIWPANLKSQVMSGDGLPPVATSLSGHYDNQDPEKKTGGRAKKREVTRSALFFGEDSSDDDDDVEESTAGTRGLGGGTSPESPSLNGMGSPMSSIAFDNEALMSIPSPLQDIVLDTDFIPLAKQRSIEGFGDYTRTALNGSGGGNENSHDNTSGWNTPMSPKLLSRPTSSARTSLNCSQRMRFSGQSRASDAETATAGIDSAQESADVKRNPNNEPVIQSRREARKYHIAMTTTLLTSSPASKTATAADKRSPRLQMVDPALAAMQHEGTTEYVVRN